MPDAVPTRSIRFKLTILGVLALAALLRFWTIGDGVPYAVSVDEPAIMEVSVRMVRTGDLNPHFFDYPGLVFYLHAAVASARFLTGAMAGKWSSLDQVWLGDFYLWARLATAVIGVLTVYVVYRAGLRWGTTAAALAALVMAIHPQHVRESHLALTDTPLTFFVALTLLLSLCAAEERRLRWFLLAGLAAGLAAGVKYNGLVAAAMPLVVASGSRSLREAAATIGAVAAGTIGGFLAASPYALLDLPNFLNGFASLMQHYNHDASALHQADAYSRYLRNWFSLYVPGGRLHPFTGWPALGLSLLGIVTLGFRLQSDPARSRALALIVFPVVYFWFVANQSLVFGRYLLPLVPALSILLGIGGSTGRDLISGPRARPWARRGVLAGLTAVALIGAVCQAVGLDWSHRAPSAAAQGAQWLVEHARPDEPIVVEGDTLRLPPRYRVEYVHRLIDRPLDAYRENGVRYLIASSAEYDPILLAPEPARVADQIAAYRILFRLTEPAATYAPAPGRPDSTIRVLRIPPG